MRTFILAAMLAMACGQFIANADDAPSAAPKGNQGYIIGTPPASPPAAAEPAVSPDQTTDSPHPLADFIAWIKKVNEWQEEHLW